MAIGCELRSLEWWWNETDKYIIDLGGKEALRYWQKAKPILFGLAEECGYWSPPASKEN